VIADGAGHTFKREVIAHELAKQGERHAAEVSPCNIGSAQESICGASLRCDAALFYFRDAPSARAFAERVACDVVRVTGPERERPD
jgi:hypothetical protein